MFGNQSIAQSCGPYSGNADCISYQKLSQICYWDTSYIHRTNCIKISPTYNTYKGPVSLPPRGGSWELLVGVPDANRDRRTRRGVQVCLVPLSGSSWDVNT